MTIADSQPCRRLIAGLVALLSLATSAIAAEPAKRIVTCGGAVTEIIYALGEESRLVGVDSSSTYPEAAMQLPSIGIHRFLSAEGILSLKPDLLLVTADAGPTVVLEQVAAAGVKVVHISTEHTIDAAIGKINQIAEAIGTPEKGTELAAKVQQEIDDAKQQLPAEKPKAIFIYARGPMMLVAGRNTGGGSMLELAGAVNPVTGYTGYKPLTAESLVVAAPEIIVLTNGGLQGAGGVDGALKIPGVAQTPAGKNRRIVAMDDLTLLGFGPRIGQAIAELAGKLHTQEAN